MLHSLIASWSAFDNEHKNYLLFIILASLIFAVLYEPISRTKKWISQLLPKKKKPNCVTLFST